MKPVQFRSVGECMAELQQAGGGLYSLAFGGDTLNTSWYVRALTAPEDLEIEYVSALGADPLSQDLLAFLTEHGIGSRFVQKIPDRNIGLYLISLANGERSFTYWRNNSAARLLSADEQHLAHAFASAGAIYISGITLAILSPEHREILLHQLRQMKRQGATIAFDSNTRPKLWPSERDMKDAMIKAYEVATLALPTFGDEQLLFGDKATRDCARRIADYGVAEIIVKDGANASCALGDDIMFETVPGAVPAIVDTTGAGDSFNAGYLASRLAGSSMSSAIERGHQVAGRVIQQRGALASMMMFADLRVKFPA